MPVDRVETGIPGLDKLMEGGVVKNSVNLLAGQTGTGKTIFGCQYLLHGAKKGEKGLYISLEQKEDDIINDVQRFSWGEEFLNNIKNKKLIIVYTEFPNNIKELNDRIYSQVKKFGIKRLVLDSVSIATMGWKQTMEINILRRDLFDLMDSTKKMGVTSMLITEIPETDIKALSRFGFEEFIVDSIIKLHYLEYAAGELNRSLIIRKMRRTEHGADIYPMEISNKGIIVKPIRV